MALALEHLKLGHFVAVHREELHLPPRFHLVASHLLPRVEGIALHLKLNVELVDEEVDGGGGAGPAGVDVQQEEVLPLQQGLPLTGVLRAFRKLILLLSCHLSANENSNLHYF